MARSVFLFILLSFPFSLSFGQPVPLTGMPTWSTSEQDVYSTGMVWRDCNRDGVIDVFFSNGNDIVQAANNIYLFGGDPPPTSASWYSTNQEYSGHCAVGDIDDDGYPDLVVSNYIGTGFGDPNRSDLYLNQGGLPSVAPDWQTPEEMFSFSSALGDIDLDGDLDLVLATGEGYQQDYESDLIYFNNGGSFTSPPGWQSAAATAAVDVALGDVDNDGDLDLAFTYDSRATALYLNNAGTVATTPAWEAGTVESGNTLVFGDVNGDGWLDLVVAYNNQLNGQGRFRVYFNDGTGNLDPAYGWQSATGGYGSALALGDYDNDGDYDLAAGRWFSDLFVYENEGAIFGTSPVWSSDIDMVAEELAWVDIDAGGVLQLADTIPVVSGRKLFYTAHCPLYEIDSLLVDGSLIGDADFCYDLIGGWVALAAAPTTELIIHCRYSYHNDLAVSNWDTVNMVFGNTTPPFVNASATNTFGPVPLVVAFEDISVGATAWDWTFGDGSGSTVQSPDHDYAEPGVYDVRLEITTPERTYSRTYSEIVAAYADTLWLTHAKLSGGEARVDLYATHFMPWSELVVPFSWDGTMDLRFDSMSTIGSRLAYWDQKGIQDRIDAWKVASLQFTAGAQPDLEPGSGLIASLYFTDLGSASDSSSIFFHNYLSEVLVAYTTRGPYLPELVDGSVFSRCCEGRVGDANQQSGDEPTIGDISVIVDMLFITEVEVACMSEADINQSGGVNPVKDDVTIGDISTLIDYLFITGQSAGLADCL